FVFDNLPFGFAIPMLTGWELSYFCADEYVQAMGVWIEDFSYDRTTGKLSATVKSVIADVNADEGFRSRIKLSVLGLTTKLPDLVIVQPDQTQHFCRR